MVFNQRQLSGPFSFFLSVVLALFFAGCGGGRQDNGPGPTAPPTPAVQISISPTSASLAVNATREFTATVTNASDSTVTWSVQETGGGSVGPSGTYTAPGLTGTYHVVATSHADPGKKATASVTVTAPPLTISFEAPTKANEGDLYQYAVSVTDPGNGTLSYKLTGPEIATISTAGVVSWTPTSQQSRKSNSFAVEVTSSTGAKTSQSWTVSPTGVVRCVVNEINVSANGRVPKTADPMSTPRARVFGALVKTSAGEFTNLSPDRKDDGTYEISRVPAGYYSLSVLLPDPLSGGQYSGLMWTDKSSVDLSYTVPGRTATLSDGNLVRNYAVTGMAPWQEGNWLEWRIPNISESSYFGYRGGVTAETTEWTFSGNARRLADESTGDLGVMNQMAYHSLGGADYVRIVRSSGPIALTDHIGEPTTVNAAMHDPEATLTLRAKIKTSDFDSLYRTTHRDAQLDWSWFAAYVHPFDLTKGFAGWGESVGWGPTVFYFDNLAAPQKLAALATTGGDLDLGDLTIGNPYPSAWPLFYDYEEQNLASVTAPGATYGMPIYLRSYQLTSDKPTIENPIKPLLAPITTATIDGKNIFVSQTDISLTPTFSWQPPTFGNANAYLFRVCEVFVNLEGQTSCLGGGLLWTTATSILIPPGILQPNKMYIIFMSAFQETGVDLEKTPRLMGFPRAQAQNVSAVFSTIAVPDSAAISVNEDASFMALMNSVKSEVTTTPNCCWGSPASQSRVAARTKAATAIK